MQIVKPWQYVYIHKTLKTLIRPKDLDVNYF
jgi:hypothetical protein